MNLPLPPAQALAARRGERITVRRPMEPQPDNPETFGISPVWGQGVPRSVGKYCVHAAFNENGKRVDRWLPAPFQPGDVVLLQGSDLSLVCVSVAAEMGEAWEWVFEFEKVEGAI